ncbi:MAG: bifunctional folylpolyglutamate synthase/dihydrofolate synthase [Emergencia sp.]
MDAISKIHEFLRFGSVLGLERMEVLLEKLGNPHRDLKVIHVAGTNGKGSICRYVYEVLQAGGYKTGLYTSPYLEVFNERIEFDGAYITDDELEECSASVLEKAEEMVAEGLESPTEFEVVTAVAFVFFQQKHADYVVLEVGLGGTGDSTNVVKNPLCCIIASISLDHTDRLGDTLEQIAGEKAGIIKEGCPVITGSDQPDVMEVFRKKAKEMNAPLYDSRKLPCRIVEETVSGCRFESRVMGKTYELEITMAGEHQVRNAVEALQAVVLLNREEKIQISDDAIREGFRTAKQIGRFEIMQENPYVILDGAHNPDGAASLAETVLRRFAGKRILMVTGILADKEVDQVTDTFLKITGDFIITEPDNPRKLDADALAEKFESKGGRCEVCPVPEEAVRRAQEKSGDYDVVLFAGSLYLIGAIRGMLHG